MNKKLKIFLGLLIFGALSAAIVYKYAMRRVADLSESKADFSITAADAVAKLSNADTSALKIYSNKILSISGMVLDITKDSTALTITIGADSTNANTIICQADARHIAEFDNFKKHDAITIKGNYTGYNIDDELGLGSSLQLKNCVINK
jgi:tRNA_anti-like